MSKLNAKGIKDTKGVEDLLMKFDRKIKLHLTKIRGASVESGNAQILKRDLKVMEATRKSLKEVVTHLKFFDEVQFKRLELLKREGTRHIGWTLTYIQKNKIIEKEFFPT